MRPANQRDSSRRRELGTESVPDTSSSGFCAGFRVIEATRLDRMTSLLALESRSMEAACRMINRLGFYAEVIFTSCSIEIDFTVQKSLTGVILLWKLTAVSQQSGLSFKSAKFMLNEFNFF